MYYALIIIIIIIIYFLIEKKNSLEDKERVHKRIRGLEDDWMRHPHKETKNIKVKS